MIPANEKHTNEELFRRQGETLNLFFSKHAITQAQFDKSYRDLTGKMRTEKTSVDKIGIYWGAKYVERTI